MVVEFYLREGYRLLHQRLKTPYAEIDLVFKSSSGHVILVEVKAVTAKIFYGARLSLKQRQRLRRAFEWYCYKTQSPIEFHLVFVDQKEKIQIYKNCVLS